MITNSAEDYKRRSIGPELKPTINPDAFEPRKSPEASAAVGAGIGAVLPFVDHFTGKATGPLTNTFVRRSLPMAAGGTGLGYLLAKIRNNEILGARENPVIVVED